ncbi:hypothetical protein KP509_16G058600 [Ceratopteris richardii]|nr:hypothetical protein KP509_16G058600 [Ceratopteris richardii]
MGKTDFSLDVNNFVYLLEASGRLGDVVKGQQIHAHIYSQCLLENSIELGNALINMYVHCDALEKAQDVFDELPVKDLLSWVAITSGYALHGHGEECLACFERMHSAGLSPNATMCAYALKSCGNIGAACTGQKIHADIVKKGLLEDNVVLTLALLVMYANCGLIAEAQQMFEELPVHDVIAWTALIAVYARFEKDDIVRNLFNEMIEECVEPDIITLAVVSDSCYRTGCMEYIQTYSRMESIGYTINSSVSVGNDIIKLSDIAVYSDFLTHD